MSAPATASPPPRARSAVEFRGRKNWPFGGSGAKFRKPESSRLGPESPPAGFLSRPGVDRRQPTHVVPQKAEGLRHPSPARFHERSHPGHRRVGLRRLGGGPRAAGRGRARPRAAPPDEPPHQRGGARRRGRRGRHPRHRVGGPGARRLPPPVPRRRRLPPLGPRPRGDRPRQPRRHPGRDGGGAGREAGARRLHVLGRDAEAAAGRRAGRRDGPQRARDHHRGLQDIQGAGRAAGGVDGGRGTAGRDRPAVDPHRPARREAHPHGPHRGRGRQRQDAGLHRHGAEPRPRRRRGAGPPAGVAPRPDRRALHPRRPGRVAGRDAARHRRPRRAQAAHGRAAARSHLPPGLCGPNSWRASRGASPSPPSTR